MTEHTSLKQRRDRFSELVEDIQFAMLTTAAADGTLRSRPMTVLEHEFDGDMWFFISKSAAFVRELGDDAQVNLSFAKPGDHSYVSVSGTARVVDDQARKDEFWRTMHQVWFPDGKDDPDLALLQFSADEAEYWDVSAGHVQQVIGLARAIVSGERPDIGDNEKLDLAP